MEAPHSLLHQFFCALGQMVDPRKKEKDHACAYQIQQGNDEAAHSMAAVAFTVGHRQPDRPVVSSPSAGSPSRDRNLADQHDDHDRVDGPDRVHPPAGSRAHSVGSVALLALDPPRSNPAG